MVAMRPAFGEMPDVHHTVYSKRVWKLIHHALTSYVIDRENQLRTENVGDREWNELFDYQDIIRDIELHIIQPEDD